MFHWYLFRYWNGSSRLGNIDCGAIDSAVAAESAVAAAAAVVAADEQPLAKKTRFGLFAAGSIDVDRAEKSLDFVESKHW